MTKLEEKYFKLSKHISDKFNAHSYEERVENCLYTNDTQCLTLIQILLKYDHLLPKIAKDKIKKWLANCINELEKLAKENGIND